MPQVAPPKMSLELAEFLTEKGLYHGTALYHLGPKSTMDARELATARWGDRLYTSFGGLYVTIELSRAEIFARTLAYTFREKTSYVEKEDVAPVVYRIRLLEGCEYALDEDVLGWIEYVGRGHVKFSQETFLDFVSEQEEKQLLKKLSDLKQSYDFKQVPLEAAQEFYDNISKEYAPYFMARAEMLLYWPAIRLLNDKWEILEAWEIP